MKPLKKPYWDGGTLPDSYFLDLASKMVDRIRKNPNSQQQKMWKNILNECGDVMRYRMLVWNVKPDMPEEEADD